MGWGRLELERELVCVTNLHTHSHMTIYLYTHEQDKCCGTIVCKMDRHKCSQAMRGYVAMIVVDKK